MGLQLSLKKRRGEIEEAVFPAHFDQPEIFKPVINTKGGDTVYIIPEDNKDIVKPALWAYGDYVLEDIMFGKNYMKCIILADSVFQNDKKLLNSDEIRGICGVCIDYGGDNYITFPIIQKDGDGEEIFRTCSNGEFQSYLHKK